MVRQSSNAKQAAFGTLSGPPIVAEMCAVAVPTTLTCSSSGAYTFTGASDSFVSATSLRQDSTVGGGLGFTLSVWVYRSSTADNWSRMIDFGNGEDADNIIVAFKGGLKYRVIHGNPSVGKDTIDAYDTDCGSTTAFPSYAWTHVAIVHSRSSTSDANGN